MHASLHSSNARLHNIQGLGCGECMSCTSLSCHAVSLQPVLASTRLPCVGSISQALRLLSIKHCAAFELTPGVQAITEPEERYEAYCQSSDFIREHVFPGGHLPSLGAMVDAAGGTGLLVHDVADIGPGKPQTQLRLLATAGPLVQRFPQTVSSNNLLHAMPRW